MPATSIQNNMSWQCDNHPSFAQGSMLRTVVNEIPGAYAAPPFCGSGIDLMDFTHAQ